MTHPLWFAHMQRELEEVNDGVYQLKGNQSMTKFILGTELSVIKKDQGKTRRVHHCVFAPNVAAVKKLNDKLEADGCNLKSDGRPILGMTSRQLLEYILEVDDRMQLIPAHAWTPWFGVFGSKGGYDSLEEAFGDLAPHIKAIETGLSSDPVMNRMCSWLDGITLVSNSDAHSPQKLGREANVLSFDSEADITYDEIFRIINEGDRKKFNYTIEFYPEEGKYHTDGHRDCNFSCSPEETKKYKGICPKCKKKLTVGVLYRVHELADRSEVEAKKLIDQEQFISYRSIVPLPEILSDVYGVGVNTKTVNNRYDALTRALGSEFHILEHASIEDINHVSDNVVAEAIKRVREGNIVVFPGYDGMFGMVKVFDDAERKGPKQQVFL
jgi:uncharacterized protein (TIGR00375 family)